MLTEAQDKQIVAVYKDAETEAERQESIVALAKEFGVSEMYIRQVLQIEKVYKVKEGKTEKEQYAHALWAITGIDKKQWMKLSLQAKKDLMEVFKRNV